jgi:hypothetical protein
MDRPKLAEQGGGLISQVGLRLHEDDAGAVFEQHPRLVGIVKGCPPSVDQFGAFHE